MPYQVLARKWRPPRFEDLVGQEHAVRALSNALDKQRLHHAYLFTGSRGVGKTTIARILSKCLNCEQGVSARPCGECTSCQEIDEGRFIDLLEVDAASRTKVDQTRELLDNVPFAPVRGRYKVYLIDEVHMFSQSSFNALLKTLEEPPPHVKFLLATTDPQKVPVTVLSRCLQFNLKLLLPDQIQGQLTHILEAERISFDSSALALLARAADGSMRDALSLLDQAIAFGGGKVQDTQVRAMLGTISRDLTLALAQALADQNGAAVLEQVARIAEFSSDFSAVLKDLLQVLHRIALYQQVPESLPPEDLEAEPIAALAAAIPPEDTQLYYQIALIGQQDLTLAPEPRTGIEMVLLRMLAFRPDVARGQDRKGQETSRSARPAPVAAPARQPMARGDEAVPSSVGEAKAALSSMARAGQAPREGGTGERISPQATVSEGRIRLANAEDWHQLVGSLSIGGIASELVRNCVFLGWDGKKLRLGLDPACQNLRVASAEGRLRQSLASALGAGFELVFDVVQAEEETPAQRKAREDAERQRQAEQVMVDDPVVRTLEENFGAQWVPGSIKPTDAGGP